MSTTDLNAACPWCGRMNDAHSGAKGLVPHPGAVGLCWGCAKPGIFNDDLSLRKPTETELAEIEAEPEYVTAVRVIALSVDPIEAADRIWGEH